MPCASMCHDLRPAWTAAVLPSCLAACIVSADDDWLPFWRDLGFTDVHFNADGMLEVANTQPACVPGPSGEPLFFNLTFAASKAEEDLAAVPFVCTYGNGALIQPETVQDVTHAQWDSA